MLGRAAWFTSDSVFTAACRGQFACAYKRGGNFPKNSCIEPRSRPGDQSAEQRSALRFVGRFVIGMPGELPAAGFESEGN